jgi:SAM-dependent methyltransferase
MNDVLGQALADYQQGTFTGKLWVHNKYGPKEEMPVKVYFRTMDEMPELEWVALQECRGRILDIGAGAGSHALVLQQMGQDVTALEISPLSAGVMRERGVSQILCQDFFQLAAGGPDSSRTAGQAGSDDAIADAGTGVYDTLLLMMNGIGLAGTLTGLRLFFRQARLLLRPGGQLLFDSSNIAYLYGGNPPKTGDYYGEVLYQYGYKRQRSDWFKWLFIDRHTLAAIAGAEGWKTDVICEDDKDQFLVRCRWDEPYHRED